MAEKKALFKIEINGITESVSAVKDLNDQLKELKGYVKDLEKAKVKVKVETVKPTSTEVVSGNSNDQTQQAAQQNNALAKLAEQLAKAQAKAQAQVTDEYKSQYQELQKVNEQVKENDKLQKQISQGVRDTNGEYANTLSGLRAYLSELQKTFNQQEIGTDAWKQTQAELTRVRELVKGIEQSTGDFRRNVGNYPSGAKQLVTLFQQTQQTIADAKAELTSLNQQLSQTQSGSQQYTELSSRIDDLTQSMSAAESQAEDLNDALSQKVQIDVGGTIQYYDNLKQAAADLQKTLQQLVLEGKANTEEFNQTIEALGRVRTAMQNVSSEVTSYIGNAKGLKDTVEVMQGLTSLASLGVGLQGLFGGESKELDKALRKFTQLTLIMNGLSELQKQINDKTSIWGQSLGKVWNTLQSVSGKLTNFTGADKLSQDVEFVVNYDNLEKELAKVSKEVSKAAMEMSQTASDSVYSVIRSVGDGMDEVAANGASAVETSLWEIVDTADKAAQDIQARINNLSIDPVGNADSIAQLNRELTFVQEQSQKASDVLGQLTAGMIDQEEAAKRLAQIDSEMAGSIARAGGASEDAIEAFNELTEQQEQLQEQMNATNASMGKWGKTLSSWGPIGTKVAKGIKAVSGAIRGLMSATVILAVIQALMLAIEWLVDGIKKLSGQDMADAVKDFDGLSASIQNSKDQLSQFNKEVDRAKAAGEINELEANRRKLDEVSKAAERAGKEMQQFISTLEDVHDIDLSEDKEDAWFATRYIKDMDEYEKRYKQLVQAVSQGVDESKVVTGSGSMFLTASDAATNLAKAQKEIIGELENRINNLDFSKGEETYKQFLELINNGLYSSALANIDKLFEDDEWQKGLKKRIDQYRDFAQQMYDLNTSIAASTKQMEAQIASNLAAAITDPYERANAQRKLQMEQELADAEGNERLQESIRKKYATQELDAKKAHNKQLASEAKSARQRRLQIESDAQQAEINLMAEGLTKQRELLKLQSKQAIAAAKENGASKETLLKIQVYWNNQILNAEKEFARQVFLAERERQRTMDDEFHAYLDTIDDWESTIQKRLLDFKKFQTEFAKDSSLDAITEKFKTAFLDAPFPPVQYSVIKEYYDAVLKAKTDYYEEAHKNDVKAAEQEYEEQQRDLDNLLRERTNYYSDWLTQQNDATEARFKQGLISEEEYNRQLAENQATADEHVVEERKKWNSLLESLETEHNQRLLEIDKEYHDNIQSLNAENYTQRREALTEFYTAIQEQMERHTKENKRFMGIINYKAERDNLKKAQNEFKQVLQAIEMEYQNLQQQLDNNEISFDDFRKAKKELDSLKQKTQDTLKDVTKNLDNLIVDTVKSVTDMAQQYVQAFSDIWSMISNLKDIELDQQEKRLEREQELLDEELEMLEKQYSKQQELTRKHTDKINDIEGELTDARGDRRDFLLDQLARERDAELKSLETENQIQQQKEQNEKKQEALERQKEQLEKKRWEQNKKNQVVQATINTFTAVTNALAVQPWFVGLALSAVALALGMANVAKIQSQKYYADGGLLTGKPHSQGGIPVGRTGIEVEGGEFVINRRTTRYNQSLLEYVNSQRRPLTREDLISFYDNGRTSIVPKSLKAKFADGGNLPKMDTAAVEDLINNNRQTDEKEVVVSVVDIINRMENIQRVKVLAGLGD